MCLKMCFQLSFFMIFTKNERLKMYYFAVIFYSEFLYGHCSNISFLKTWNVKLVVLNNYFLAVNNKIFQNRLSCLTKQRVCRTAENLVKILTVICEMTRFVFFPLYLRGKLRIEIYKIYWKLKNFLKLKLTVEKSPKI